MTYDADSRSSDTELGDEQSSEDGNGTETGDVHEQEPSPTTATDTDANTDREHARESHRNGSNLGADPSPELDHVTIDNGEEADECAIFPADAPEEELMTNWISAIEGSFVDLESMR